MVAGIGFCREGSQVYFCSHVLIFPTLQARMLTGLVFIWRIAKYTRNHQANVWSVEAELSLRTPFLAFSLQAVIKSTTPTSDLVGYEEHIDSIDGENMLTPPLLFKT